MISIKKILIFFFLFFFNLNTYANENVAFIDIDYLFINSNLGKAISIKLEKINAENLKIITSKKKILEEDENEINKTKNIISKEELNKKISLFKKNIDVYNREKDDILKKFEIQKNKELESFFKKINPLLQDYMSQKSISLLLEKKSIFIGKENVDITNDMLELINNNFK